jgi:hypothetical protein
MSTNFHTAWTDGVIIFEDSSMNDIPSKLDRAITFIKNVVITCDGDISYNKATGVLSWSGTLRFLFTNSNGYATQNTASAGSVTLTDGKFAYVDLSETNDATVVVYAATLTTGSSTASNTITYNRLVLAYRNTTNDNLTIVNLHLPLNDPTKIIQTLTCADSVTVDWSKGHTALITLDRALTTFTFTGGSALQSRLVLRVTQYAGTGSIDFTSEVTGGSDLSLPVSLSTETGKKDYIGFIYDPTDAEYHFVGIERGY